jgi:hypothetical protein
VYVDLVSWAGVPRIGLNAERSDDSGNRPLQRGEL